MVTPACSGPRRLRGISLVEVLIASALAAVLLGALARISIDGLTIQRDTSDTNEMLFQARFAVGHVVARAEATPPRTFNPPPANTTGDWFGAVRYCLNTSTSLLIETTQADTACVGTRVIADNISAFSVQLAAAGPLDRPVALVTLTATDSRGRQSFTLTGTARFGGSSL